MKAKLVRAHDTKNPAYEETIHQACIVQGKPYRVPMTKRVPEGTIIEHPDAWRLVQVGAAVPEDDECREAAGMSDKQIQAAVKAVSNYQQGIIFNDKGKRVKTDPINI